jgi:hypothetical protein
VEATAGSPRRTPWLEAAVALASGDVQGAAERYAALGAKPDEAFTRLVAAGELIDQGRRADAESELERALSFLRSVGATPLVQRGERLLAASA